MPASPQLPASTQSPSSPENGPAAQASRGALLIVFLTVFIDLLGFGIVLPVMPRQAEPYLKALGLSPLAAGVTIGVLFSVFSLMQFIFSPLWGRISDRIGRRPMLLLSLVGSVVFYALYGFAVTVPTDRATTALALMLLSRVGAGIAGASVGTAAAVIADCTTPANRARGMALIGIAFGAGFTLGPLIAYFGLALFSQRPWGVGALASMLSFVALLIAFFIFKETRRPGVRSAKEFPSMSRTAAVLQMPQVGALVLIYFLAIFSFANFEATLARLTEAAFQMNNDDNFLVFAFIGLMLMFAGGIYRPLAKRLPETRLLTAGIAMMMLGLACVGLVAWGVSGRQGDAGLLKTLFYAASAMAVAGFAFVNPSVSALISKNADPDRQGEVLGVNQSFSSLGRILGPFVGSMLFALNSTHTLPYVVAVAVLMFVATLLPRLSRPAGASG